MKSVGNTTCFAVNDFEESILTGEEDFPIYGPEFHEIMEGRLAEIAIKVHDNRKRILKRFKGLQRHWACLEKAYVVRDFIGDGRVTLGATVVWNNERNGTFGYFFNPPFEFHAWIEILRDKFIIDFALPGVIEKGLVTADDQGPILKDIAPVILCGPVPNWLVYKPYAYQ